MLILRIDSKGRITLPKSFREKCGGKVIVRENEERLEIIPLSSFKTSKGKYPLEKRMEEIEEEEEKILFGRNIIW